MPAKHAAGGCHCCENCAVSSDDFNRVDAEDPGTDWTEVSGDADIVSNALQVAASSIVIHNTSSTIPTVIVTATVTLAAGEAARLILGYVDSSNYFYAEYTEGSPGTITINQVASGVDTELATLSDTVATGDILVFCASERGHMRAWCTSSSGVLINTGVYATGKQQGLATDADQVEFDDFTVNKIDEERGCTGCSGDGGCSRCTGGSGKVPDLIYVRIDNYDLSFLPGSPLARPPCEDGRDMCQYQNGVFALAETSTCQWEYAELIACNADIGGAYSGPFTLAIEAQLNTNPWIGATSRNFVVVISVGVNAGSVATYRSTLDESAISCASHSVTLSLLSISQTLSSVPTCYTNTTFGLIATIPTVEVFW